MSHRKAQTKSLACVFATLFAVAASSSLACGSPEFDPGDTHSSDEVIQVTISPSEASIQTGESVDFAASVTGTATKTVTWSVQETSDCGSVTQGGAYSAPTVTAQKTCHVVARSAADTTKAATATVTITAATVARAYYLHPFTSASLWNAPLADGETYFTALDPATANYRSVNGTLNYGPNWTIGVWYSHETDPEYPVRSASDTSHTYVNVRVPSNWLLPGPEAPAQRDGWLTIIQPDGASSLEFYKMTAVYDGTTLSYFTVTRAPARADLRGDGYALNTSGIDASPGTWGMRASALTLIGGLIRHHEVMSENIPHSVAIGVPNSVLKSGFVWPARSQDSDAATAYTGEVPMGSRFALPWDTDVDALGLQSDEGKALARALIRYGGWIAERSSHSTVMAELAVPGSADYTEYLSACARLSTDWNTLTHMLVRVSGHTPSEPGGPGTPRYPPTPEGTIVSP